MSKRIAIVGAGASGMMAAITAAKHSEAAQITIYEKNKRPGKKLLSTGNGRCNITNIDCGYENYHGTSPRFVEPALSNFGPVQTLSFFESIGLMCKTAGGGRVYPYCEQAAAVLDVLRNELARVGVRIEAETAVTGIERISDGFRLVSKTGDILCDKVVISTGGKAAPTTGSDGNGFALLSSLGHRIIEPYPALAQLKTANSLASAMQGVRLHCRAKAVSDSVIAESIGEVQFTAYGLSGPAILDISAKALTAGGTVVLDLMPHMSLLQLVDVLNLRRESLSHLTAESFLTGMLNKRVGQVILKHIGVGKLTAPVSRFSDELMMKLAETIKNLEFIVKGHAGWEHAQATGGGADVSCFNGETMESTLVRGLFATGEALDIYGDCGGYNLQWAWSSGHAAGVGL